MPRIAAIVVVALTCCSGSISSQEAQPGKADTMLVLKDGAEVRGVFVGLRDGLFTLRLPDGRTMTYPAGDVDSMQPLAVSPPSVPVSTPPVGEARAPQRQNEPLMDTSANTALEAKACGPEGFRFSTVTDRTQHPTPSAPSDKGLVYVVRATMTGDRIQTRLAVDGSWVGANRGNNYFFLTLNPGEHYFCSQAEDRSVLALTVEAGKTYYLQQTISMGFMKARTGLQAITEQGGQAALTKTHPSVWKEGK